MKMNYQFDRNNPNESALARVEAIRRVVKEAYARIHGPDGLEDIYWEHPTLNSGNLASAETEALQVLAHLIKHADLPDEVGVPLAVLNRREKLAMENLAAAGKAEAEAEAEKSEAVTPPAPLHEGPVVMTDATTDAALRSGDPDTHEPPGDDETTPEADGSEGGDEEPST